MKEFQGTGSIVIDFGFSIKANSLEEAKEKIIEAEGLDINIVDDEGNKIVNDFDVNDWYIVDKAQQGNIQQSGINDFDIWEEK